VTANAQRKACEATADANRHPSTTKAPPSAVHRALGVLSTLSIAAALPAFGCSTLGYVAQATRGQFELARAARPLNEVLADDKTPPRTRELLSDVVLVKQFARQRGLRVAGNYEQYVELPRDYPVWFVNASAPLAFQPVTFSFPILGSFPGLAWFAEADADRFAAGLRARGYDVHKRGVGAFSTGGWLDDPVVWTMLSSSPAALGYLINTILHESVHATVLVKNQQYFNESLASFVADRMTDEFMKARFGSSEPAALQAYKNTGRWGQTRAQQLSSVYQELDQVYQSQEPDATKRTKKEEILDRAVARYKLRERPNNASLIGFRLYQVGGADFSALHTACGGNWRRFLNAVSQLPSSAFGQPQQSEIGPTLQALAERGCPDREISLERDSKPRFRSKQRRRLRRIWHRD
jgi:predicted aminopeptidase